MRILKVVFLAVLLVFYWTMPLYAQGDQPGKVAVLFEGTTLRGSPRFLNDNAGLAQMSASRNIFPGVEVRFNQNSRITIGASYQRWTLEGQSETSFLEFQKGITLHPQTGEPLASVTYDSGADAKVLSSTAYINLLTRGKIRPFVALGGGVALINQTISTTTFVHPGIKEVIGYQFQFENLDGARSNNLKKPTVKGLAGVNIFPGAHTMMSVSGGYNNGTVLNFGFGYLF